MGEFDEAKVTKHHGHRSGPVVLKIGDNLWGE